MQKCEATMDEYIKLYNQTLKLFKIAKEEFNKITCNSFDKIKFEEIRSQLNEAFFNLTMCHYKIAEQSAIFSENDIAKLAKYYNLQVAINRILIDFKNYKILLDNASSKFTIEDENEMTIN